MAGSFRSRLGGVSGCGGGLWRGGGDDVVGQQDDAGDQASGISGIIDEDAPPHPRVARCGVIEHEAAGTAGNLQTLRAIDVGLARDGAHEGHGLLGTGRRQRLKRLGQPAMERVVEQEPAAEVVEPLGAGVGLDAGLADGGRGRPASGRQGRQADAAGKGRKPNTTAPRRDFARWVSRPAAR